MRWERELGPAGAGTGAGNEPVLIKSVTSLITPVKTPWIFTLASSLLIGIAAWVEGRGFLIIFAFFPFYFVLDSLPKKRALFWTVFFVVSTGLILGSPLLGFRSVQSLPLVSSQYYFLGSFILGYIVFLSLLATIALWIPLVALKSFRIAIFPVVWILFELVKTKLSFGLAWLTMGEFLVDFLPLGIFARWGGIYLLSFLVMALSISAYESIIYFVKKNYLLPFSMLSLWSLLVVSGYIYQDQIRKESLHAPNDNLKVAVLQPGSAAQTIKQKAFFEDLYIRSRNAARVGDIPPVDLLIFPANFWDTLNLAEFEKKRHAEEILGFRPPADAILAGFSLSENGQKYQANALVGKSGTKLAFKEFLFPVSDYLPSWVKILGLKTPSAQHISRPNVPLELSPLLSIGVASCNEGFVPQLFSRFRKEGVKLAIISGSIDDFSTNTAYFEMLRTARMRSLENGIWTVLAMKSGISAIIDPFGRVTASLGKDETGVLVGEIFVTTK